MTLTVSDSVQNVVGAASYTVAATDLPPPSIVDINIALPAPKELIVEVDPFELPADGTSTSTITITVRDGGEGVTGDTISVSTDNGTVGRDSHRGRKWRLYRHVYRTSHPSVYPHRPNQRQFSHNRPINEYSHSAETRSNDGLRLMLVLVASLQTLSAQVLSPSPSSGWAP